MSTLLQPSEALVTGTSHLRPVDVTKLLMFLAAAL